MISTSSSHVNPLFTSAFEQRFEALERASTSSLLKDCLGLKDFLPRAITFLKAGDNARFNEQVAHYLMGKVDYLLKEQAGIN